MRQGSILMITICKLIEDGIPSRLTSEQYGKLKEAWIELYKLMDGKSKPAGLFPLETPSSC